MTKHISVAELVARVEDEEEWWIKIFRSRRQAGLNNGELEPPNTPKDV